VRDGKIILLQTRSFHSAVHETANFSLDYWPSGEVAAETRPGSGVQRLRVGDAAAVSAPPFCLGKGQRGGADKGAGPGSGGAPIRRATQAASAWLAVALVDLGRWLDPSESSLTRKMKRRLS